MKVMLLGDCIRIRRKELGLTQQELCQGICSDVTISRIESGIQTPRRNVANALLQRLGIPAERFYTLVSENEEKIDDLKKEIVSCNINHEMEEGLRKIEELESIIEPDDNVNRQFILRSKVLLGKPDGAYSNEESMDMLLEAIHMTVPLFKLNKICDFVYNLDEVKIINQIAIIYSKNDDHKKAVDILRQLLEYIQEHYQNILQSGGLLPLVSHNYAQELSLCKRYEEAIEIAELGWKSCVKYGHYQFLAGLISIKAECKFFLGQLDESEQLYKQSYYVYGALGDSKNTERVQNELLEHLNIVI